jgi:cellulose synthase/poly-beta-1,6-N-acetylglucosamine synthase-like glycosyltransferase
MKVAMLVVFLASLATCLYVYFGYPLLLLVLSRLRPRPVARAAVHPPVTIVVPAHNEETVIEAKIRNCLELQYPADRLEVLVVSDGSTDRTDEIAARCAAGPVRLIRRAREGKAAALNAAARVATGDILVFTDANSRLEPGALARLTESFADPAVGGVCGNRELRPRSGADATQGGEGLYWRYDKWQKRLESEIGSIFAADGTLYAVRRSSFVPIGDRAQADDIAVSTRVVLQGYRLLFEPAAVAWEDAPAEGRAEFARKVRVTNHSVRALLALGSRLWTSGFYSVELVSHKLLRHLVPFFLLALLVSNVLLSGASALFRVLLVAHLLFYAAGLAGVLLRRTRAGRSRLLTVPYYFCLVNAAALLGVLSIARGERLAAWTPRSGLRTGGGGR